MNNARPILMHILTVIGSGQRTEREVDEFCSWVEVQVMTELFEALPKEKQEQAMHRFMTLPPEKKESVFYPYYTVKYMRERVQKTTKTAILERIVEPHWPKLSSAQHDAILSLLEQLTC